MKTNNWANPSDNKGDRAASQIMPPNIRHAKFYFPNGKGQDGLYPYQRNIPEKPDFYDFNLSY